MNDVEIRKANHQRLYLFQFRRKARPDMKFIYHCYQLFAVRLDYRCNVQYMIV